MSNLINKINDYQHTRDDSFSVKKTKDFTNNYFVNTTAMLIVANPILSKLEVNLMSDQESINARIFGTALGYLGMGLAYAKGREHFKNKLNISEKSKEIVHTIYDVAYGAAFNVFLSPPLYAISSYLASEDITFEKIATATSFGIIFGASSGIPMGYSINILRDLTGLEECKRKFYPNFIKHRNPYTKKIMATGLVIASLTTMAKIYNDTSNFEKKQTNLVSESIEVDNEPTQ